MADANQSDSSRPAASWTSTQVYVLAIICLLAGIAIGYLFRGSASRGLATSSPATPTMAPSTAAGPAGMEQQVTPEQLKHMADKKAEPVLAELQQKPKDTALLAQIGNIYYDAQQYKEAIGYYEKALAIRPADADVRTDLGTCYWYLGNADKAISEFEQSLRFNPTHPGTLLNMGVVKWQGKMDIDGAIAAWQKLLQTNPTFAQRARVQELIERAKQHANIKPGPKTSKPPAM